MMASRLPRSLTTVYKVMMTLPPPRGIMTSQKSLHIIKEGGRASDTIYKDLHTRRKDDRTRNLSWLKACVHLAATWIIGCKASTLAPSVGKSLIQSPAKMSTPSRSRSLFSRDREVERRKRCVVHPGFIDGAPRGQCSRGQVANSRPDPESIYPETAGAIPETCNVRPQERHMPIHQTPQEESLNSTHLLSKRQRDKRPQLSSAMHARLGPQEPRRPLCDAFDWHKSQNILRGPTRTKTGA
ncbi:hypothetical protein CK203_079955 [Vitis vinifera]|uniref:Uncharacterized protein n=1 Tax=Vitis vinifera TaxID=29760 RepID=A0A438E4W8_VITVI|nr:hypothetical protein CK203_079955 [Vitis vinifera]